MKFKVDVTVRSANDIIDGLTVESDAGLHMARELAQNVSRELEHATRRLSDAGALVASSKVAVADGRAAPADFERALREQQQAALLLPQHRKRVDEAEQAIGVALKRATAAVIKEASMRRDTLQGVADKLTPVLNALHDAEQALDDLVTRVMGAPACVEAVRWPASNEDQAIQSHGRDLSRAVGVPVSTTYPRTG